MTVRLRTRSGRPVFIPSPKEDDFEDVHWALSAASTLWERGEDTEALKWLRRAASAAADRDADIRAVELFKAAADVAGVVDARKDALAAKKLAAAEAEEEGADSAADTQAMAPKRQPQGAAVGERPPPPAAQPPRPGPPDAASRAPKAPGSRARARSRAINRGPMPAAPSPYTAQAPQTPGGSQQPSTANRVPAPANIGLPPRPTPTAPKRGGPGRAQAPHHREPGSAAASPSVPVRPPPAQAAHPRQVRSPQTGPPPPPRPTQAGPPTHLGVRTPPAPHAPAPSAPAASREVEAKTKRASTEPRDLVPPVPPEPKLSERFAGLGYKIDDPEEDTFIRPETMLRRALMAIDPQYADRTDIVKDGTESVDEDYEDDEDDDDDDDAKSFTPKRPYVAADGEEEDTQNRRRSEPSNLDDDPDNETTRERIGDLVAEADRRRSHVGSAPDGPREEPAGAAQSSLVPGLAAFRVAVLPIPEENDVRLIFLSPGADPPPGVAVALLVPPSPDDAELINEIYNTTDAKL